MLNFKKTIYLFCKTVKLFSWDSSILTAIIFAGSLLLINPVYALTNGIIINPDPIFEDVKNFLPGDSVISQVSITNNSGKNYETIALSGSAKDDERELASALELEVDDLPVVDLDFLLDGGILVLSDGIANNQTKTFDFVMHFKENGGGDNDYQGKSVIFDFIFIFEEEKGETATITVSGGGGGPNTSPGLMISGENELVKVTNITPYSVTITWLTNHFSTSEVIYAKKGKDGEPDEPHTLNLSAPPNFGYAHRKAGDDNSPPPKVTSHQVTLTGLEPNTTYYYRAISYASPPTISREYSFTTLEAKQESTKAIRETSGKNKRKTSEEMSEGTKKTTEAITPSVPESTPGIETEEPSILEKISLTEKAVPIEGKTIQKGLIPMLAAIGMAWKEISQSTFLAIIVILCLVILVLIGIKELKLIWKKRKKKE